MLLWGLEDMVKAYTQLAHANGDKALQAGRWPYLSQRLQELEEDYPGIRQAVIDRVRGIA